MYQLNKLILLLLLIIIININKYETKRLKNFTPTTMRPMTTEIDPDLKELFRVRTIELNQDNDNDEFDIQSSTLTPTLIPTIKKMKSKPLSSSLSSNNKNQSTIATTTKKWSNQSIESALSSNKNRLIIESPTTTTTSRPRKSKFKVIDNNQQKNKFNLEPNNSDSETEKSIEIVSKEKTIKKPTMLKQIHDYLIVVLLVSVMFAMGCSITWEQVWGHVRKPIGVIIGMISQFILLPASAYCLIYLFQIDPLHATGLLILACSPGGVTSNVFAYFCEGDLSLSVTMTSFSTVVALIMMPFNVWLYGRNLETDTLVIPYGKMTISLLSLTTPVAIGMLFNWKLPKIAPILTQIGSISGFGIIIVCQTLEVFIFPDIFNNVPLVLYAAEFLLPILGLTLGFVLASIFRLQYPIRRTIAIEAGIQNVGTALTIITLSFPFEQLRKVWLFPFLYAFSMLAICCIVAVLYHLQKRFTNKKKSLDIMDHPKIKKLQQQQIQNHQQQQVHSHHQYQNQYHQPHHQHQQQQHYHIQQIGYPGTYHITKV